LSTTPTLTLEHMRELAKRFCVPVNAFMGIDEGDIFLY
jgi:antitoxin component HigA of HigAB toxin-antitoxin module